MRAMVLAAGLGERMRPLTATRAKPALPLLNRPFIVNTLDYLKRQGVSEAVINLHHRPESIRDAVGDGSAVGLRVHYSPEPLILGTSGGLKNAESYFRDAGTFVMINSDFAIEGDLADALETHRRSKALATLILTPPPAGQTYGVVDLAGDGRITRISGRPQGASHPDARGYTFTGIHLLEPEILSHIPAGSASGINKDIYPPLIASGASIRGFVHHGRWREMGTPELYLQGMLELLAEGQHPALAALQSSAGIYMEGEALSPAVITEPPVLVGRETSIGGGSALSGGIVLGRRVGVGEGCTIRSSLLMDGARVGDGVRLSRCIVSPGASIPSGSDLARRIAVPVAEYDGPVERLERLGECWLARY